MAEDTVVDTTPVAEAPQLDLVRDLAEAIAYLADELDEHFAHEADGWRGDPASVYSRHAEVQLERIRDGINRMGWMADLISGRLDGNTCRGDAEEWLMHPRYRGAKARLDIAIKTGASHV
ncbi:MAG: hypothetical protein K2Y02_02815 [Burkholderiaceae bacterium]|nr:hypothetical protein [Burkholderiaceae bacterium]